MDLEEITSNRVLVVDSDVNSRLKWSRMLEIMGFSVRQAGSGDEALAQLELAAVDLTFFDLPLPDLNDPELLRRSRELRPEMLIIVQNNQPTIESTVAAIKVGATDYLIGLSDSKRVIDTIVNALERRAKDEERQNERLSRRIEAFLENNGKDQDFVDDELSPNRQILTSGQFLLRRDSRRLSLRGDESSSIELTKGEVDILAALMSRPGKAMSCQEIVRQAFRYESSETDAQSVVRPYVSRLRQKFAAAGFDRNLISTVRGRGYMFTAIS